MGGQFGQNDQKLHENDKIGISGSKQWGGDKPIFQVVGGGDPPPPPLGETLLIRGTILHYILNMIITKEESKWIKTHNNKLDNLINEKKAIKGISVRIQ